MTEASDNHRRKRNWATVGLAGLVVGATSIGLSPSFGQSANCITDVELEASVGDQIRSGAFAISTSTLRKAPMCSGLPLGQAIQQLRERIAPKAPRVPQAAYAPQASGSETATRFASLPSSTSAELFAYAGKDHWAKIKGRTFFEHPAVVSGLRNAGVTPAVRKEISTYEVSSAIIRQGDVLLDRGCFPHHCDTNHYRVFINATSGNAAVCLFDGGSDAKWYFGGRSAPLSVRGRNCIVDSLAQVPVEVRGALGSGATEINMRHPAMGTDNATEMGPDLGKLLVFTSPAKCEIGETLATFISDLVNYPENDPNVIPRLGKVTVPPAYRSIVGAPKQTRNEDGLNIRVPIKGQWHGIQVVALEGIYWNGGDPAGTSVVMRGSFQDVRGKLNRFGFNIPSSGHRTISDNSEFGYEMDMSLEAVANEIKLTCI